MAQFRKVALWSGAIALALAALGMKLSRPGYPASKFVSGILLGAFWAVGVWAICAGMILANWLVEHYGDKYTYQSTEGKNRGKYRFRKK
jgi:hypothetical protein